MAARQDSVFINCPFDKDYWPLLEVAVFTVLSCGFVPRSALEAADGSDVRLEKIYKLISESRYGIHDISCVALDRTHKLPRFNMPFELGLDLACKKFGGKRNKCLLVLEETKFKYQKCLSDIAGQDTQAHGKDPAKLLIIVRNWLRTSSGRTTIPGPTAIQKQFKRFCDALPGICKATGLDRKNLPFVEYIGLARTWLSQA
jgi:hypothetical protein